MKQHFCTLQVSVLRKPCLLLITYGDTTISAYVTAVLGTKNFGIINSYVWLNHCEQTESTGGLFSDEAAIKIDIMNDLNPLPVWKLPSHESIHGICHNDSRSLRFQLLANNEYGVLIGNEVFQDG
ncbi:unnamed protein product [Calicophoron daubneyi]|uniref:Uncharacterized protein n=1 Tax=Calicophoron daubneyi TaxID=300641 RepID=A0AAV2T5B5_CALDB